MSGIEIAMTIQYIMFAGVCFYNFVLKEELKELRRNKQAQKEIAEASTLDGRLIRNSNAVHTFE